jgi:hypothetical protein
MRRARAHVRPYAGAKVFFYWHCFDDVFCECGIDADDAAGRTVRMVTRSKTSVSCPVLDVGTLLLSQFIEFVKNGQLVPARPCGPKHRAGRSSQISSSYK